MPVPYCRQLVVGDGGEFIDHPRMRRGRPLDPSHLIARRHREHGLHGQNAVESVRKVGSLPVSRSRSPGGLDPTIPEHGGHFEAPRLNISGELRGTKWRPCPNWRSAPETLPTGSHREGQPVTPVLGGVVTGSAGNIAIATEFFVEDSVSPSLTSSGACSGPVSSGRRPFASTICMSCRVEGCLRCNRRSEGGCLQSPAQPNPARPLCLACGLSPTLSLLSTFADVSHSPARGKGPGSFGDQSRATLPAGRHRASYSTMLGGCSSSAQAGQSGSRRN